MFRPLDGVRVIDFTQVLAGPFATYQMALMGADVVKVEKPGEGDWTRTGGPLKALSDRRMGLGYLALNAGKKSVTLDLKQKAGLDVAHELIRSADVVVENFTPGVAERLGLGFESVCRINPHIVYTSISAFGQDGPLSRRPAYDHVVQGMCGIMLTTGPVGGQPTKVGAPYVDYATGMNAAMATVAGLLEMRRTDRAVHLDIAMLDTALMLMASLMSQHLSADWTPRQTGNEAWSASPSSGAFDTAAGLLMLAANTDVQFRRLCAAIGRDDLAADPRWRSADHRSANSAELRAALRSVFLTRTAAEWEDVLSAANVPAARVRGLEEVMAEPQVNARDLTASFRIDGHDGLVHAPAMAFKANGENAVPGKPPSALGADTEAVLASIGIGADAIARLREAGAI